jgi:hypothetical protein
MGKPSGTFEPSAGPAPRRPAVPPAGSCVADREADERRPGARRGRGI